MKRTFEIGDESKLKGLMLAILGIATAMLREFGWVVITLREKKRTNPQNDHFHGQIADIAAWHRERESGFTYEQWKRRLAEQFVFDTPELGWPANGLMISIDGKRIVQSPEPTSRFTVPQSSAFIEWLYAYGSERGVSFLVDRRLEKELLK